MLQFLPIRSLKVDWETQADNVVMGSEKTHFYCDGHRQWTEYTAESDPTAYEHKLYCKSCYLEFEQCPVCMQPKPEVVDWDITKPWDMEPQYSGEMCRDCKREIHDNEE